MPYDGKLNISPASDFIAYTRQEVVRKSVNRCVSIQNFSILWLLLNAGVVISVGRRCSGGSLEVEQTAVVCRLGAVSGQQGIAGK